MKPPRFDYHDPTTVEEVLDLLSEYGDDAKVLAGGQSLMPMLNFRLARPAHLVDINRVSALSAATSSADTFTVGAMTRQRALERSAQVHDWCPLVRRALALVGHPPIRNRGTLGGSLAHADPAAELPAVALALDARLVLRRSSGRRVVPANDFFVGQLATVTRPDELLVAVELPAWPRRTGYAIQEVAMRRGDFALGGMIGVLSLGVDGRIEAARIVGFGLADRPIRVDAAEAVLVGTEATDQVFGEAARLVSRAVDPPNDIHASADYRRRLAGVLTRRALVEAAASARRLAA